MSAFLCDPATLCGIVNYARQHSTACNAMTLRREAWDKTFEVLFKENQRSLEYRYGAGQGAVCKWFGSPVPLFVYTPAPAVTDEKVIDLCKTYDYQACEHPEYEGGAVRSLIRQIVAHAEQHIARRPVVPATVVCAECNRYVQNTPEASLEHLIACDAGDMQLDRDAAIKRIREGLKRRSGKAWSVKGGRGTAWGWIRIDAPPRRRKGYDMTEEDCAELARLLGKERVGTDGESIPASSEYYAEYVARAEGREPTMFGKQYWD